MILLRPVDQSSDYLWYLDINWTLIRFWLGFEEENDSEDDEAGQVYIGDETETAKGRGRSARGCFTVTADSDGSVSILSSDRRDSRWGRENGEALARFLTEALNGDNHPPTAATRRTFSRWLPRLCVEPRALALRFWSKFDKFFFKIKKIIQYSAIIPPCPPFQFSSV